MKRGLIIGLVLALGCTEVEGPSEPMVEADTWSLDMAADLNVSECQDDSACAFDQRCVEGACQCDPEACSPGWGCEPEARHCRQRASASCQEGMCPEGTVCSAEFGVCVLKPAPESCDTGESCGGGQACSDAQSVCVEGCCVDCVRDQDCGQGEVCQRSTCVTRPTTCQACSESMPCGGSEPYCFQGCCVACLSGVDCPGEQICREGACIDRPNCVDDPSVCASEQMCDESTGACLDPPGPCDAQDPQSCPVGQFCDAATNTCMQTPGCGLCNDDCTCPGDLVCDGFTCTGCTGLGADPECVTDGAPQGGQCIAGMCLPL